MALIPLLAKKSMPRLSQKKRDKIAEQVLHYLFTSAPEAHFTATIATELARDEEFIKELLHELEHKKLIVIVTKNKKGTPYASRKRWRLTDKAYLFYKQKQQHNKPYNL